MKNDIFISYSRHDSDVVNELVTLLEQEGYSVWIDRDGIESGDDFKRVILKAIKESVVVLFFSSKHSNASDWTAKEIGIAVKYKKHIIPILLDDSNYNEAVEFDLINLDYIDYSKVSLRTAIREKLLRTLKSKIGRDELEKERVKTKEKMRMKVSMRETQKGLSFIVNGVSFNMIKVEGGTFLMGADNGKRVRKKSGLFEEIKVEEWVDKSVSNYDFEANSDESPVHSVTVNSYYLCETEVTQALWKAVMGGNQYKEALEMPQMSRNAVKCHRLSYFEGDDLPVEEVNWNDCQVFIRKLSQQTGKSFRLPTEAEWEYAAKGGKKSQRYKYAGSNTIGNVAWYEENSMSKTQAVKTKSPNELGLYDMSGNVLEWCQDWYGIYDKESQTNPKGLSVGSTRVLRGGSYHYSAGGCRVSYRSDGAPDRRTSYIGFRLALSM